ncbi:MAG: hypothetical protein NZN28_12805, partial [Meiothermus sp.]|uniref:hypothetical protein n=1 Tax=Meiothermus sp. TaxID=1955249 RepID=UPI0025CD30EE
QACLTSVRHVSLSLLVFVGGHVCEEHDFVAFDVGEAQRDRRASPGQAPGFSENCFAQAPLNGSTNP